MSDTNTLGLLVLLANLAVFGLNLKLYTEILKDKAQDKRAALKRAQGNN